MATLLRAEIPSTDFNRNFPRTAHGSRYAAKHTSRPSLNFNLGINRRKAKIRGRVFILGHLHEPARPREVSPNGKIVAPVRLPFRQPKRK